MHACIATIEVKGARSRADLPKVSVREKPIHPLTPFYRAVRDELYRDYGRLFAGREEIEDMVRDHTHQNLRQLEVNRQWLTKHVFDLEVLEIVIEGHKAWQLAYKRFAGRRPEGLDKHKQLWAEIMIFLKREGFTYYATKFAADTKAFGKIDDKDPYRYWNPEYGRMLFVTEPDFTFHPEINKWAEDEAEIIKRNTKVMAIDRERDELREKQLRQLRPILKGYVKNGLTDKQVWSKIVGSVEDRGLRRDAWNLLHKLRESGVKPRKTITIKAQVEEPEEKPETLQQKWLDCMAHASGKPGLDGKTQDAKPFDSAVQTCTFIVYRDTGEQPSPTAFDRVKKYWEPGFWHHHKVPEDNEAFREFKPDRQVSLPQPEYTAITKRRKKHGGD